ncbi:MAG: Na+/H+ antiporter NhaA [Gammaproteobacteria bacterium]|nr:Na+/H+ antiporter NhaA [Gammaproteobacteria bacterium]
MARPALPGVLGRLLHNDSAGGLVLLAAALVALVWANSPLAASYHHLWDTPLGPAPNLHFWVNDGLMALFFLLVGLEIRRELHGGVLSDRQRALLPLVAALGGVVVPALIYMVFNGSSGLGHGWAVPTATDIAFAVGVLGLLGPRVPPSLRILLLAIAIVDDIVAILAIALFYSDGIDPLGLAVAAAATAAYVALQRSGTRPLVVSILLGVVLWGGLLWAGVHPSLAGVITGVLTAEPDADRAEEALHPWIVFGVMPLFALVNAGVSLGSLAWVPGVTPALVAGIVAGLVVGKPLGILAATALTVKLGWTRLPPDLTLPRIAVIGALAGIGFTMSIFISELAFDDPALLGAAKLAVLVASGLAGIGGLVAGYRVLGR